MIFCFLDVVVCASRVPDSHLFGRCPKSIVELIYNEELLTTTLPVQKEKYVSQKIASHHEYHHIIGIPRYYQRA